LGLVMSTNNITQEDMEDIIAIQFGTDVYFGMKAVDRAIELGTFTNLHPRSTFKFMAMLDLSPKWAEYAAYPTIFTMKQFKDFESCLKNEEKSTEEEYVSMMPPYEGEIKGFATCCSVHAGGYEECYQECQHEGDGKHYQFDDNYDREKCRKCGRFYT
jgi:hypothetical protein